MASSRSSFIIEGLKRWASVEVWRSGEQDIIWIEKVALLEMIQCFNDLTNSLYLIGYNLRVLLLNVRSLTEHEASLRSEPKKMWEFTIGSLRAIFRHKLQQGTPLGGYWLESGSIPKRRRQWRTRMLLFLMQEADEANWMTLIKRRESSTYCYIIPPQRVRQHAEILRGQHLLIFYD